MTFVTAEIKKFEEGHYMGWTHEMKALVVHGTTIEEVKKELIISLRVKIAYDYNLPISRVDAEEITPETIEKYFKPVTDHQYQMQVA